VKNLRIFAPLEKGGQVELTDCPTGRDLIQALLRERDFWTTPPKALVIEAVAPDRQVVRIIVPYDDAETARVLVSPPETES
jgi:hypothetical protein